MLCSRGASPRLLRAESWNTQGMKILDMLDCSRSMAPPTGLSVGTKTTSLLILTSGM